MENQQQKLKHLSELKENLNRYDYPVNIITYVIKKDLEISQNELRKSKEKQTDEVLPSISTFNQITQLYITQLRIPLKSLREIMFQDLKALNL